MRTNPWIGRLLALAVAVSAPLACRRPAITYEGFLGQIRDKDMSWEERAEAWQNVGRLGASEIPQLAQMLAGEDRDAAKIAGTALDSIVHHASRPRARAERRAVNAELIKLIGEGQPEVVRIKALDLLASTAEDETVPRIAVLLSESDAKMRERARWTLERIPGKASIEALLAALPSAPADFRRDLILTLGQKQATEAADTLFAEAYSDDGTIRLAAIEALARIGDQRVSEAIVDFYPMVGDFRRATLADSYLRVADTLVVQGENEPALEMYRVVLELSDYEPARCAALIGLGNIASAESLSLVLDALGEPSVRIRNAAADALISVKGGEINQHLAEASKEAQPQVKAMLLRVLAVRDAPQAAGLLKAASRDPNAEVRVTALDLLGGLDDPSLEPMLLEAAEKGSPQVREVALRSYLKIADGRLRAEQKKQALAMYHRALDLASDRNARLSALEGIRSIASPESLSRVEKVMDEQWNVRDDAARAYIAIVSTLAAAGRRQEAIDRLSALVTQTRSASVATLAIRRLRKLGADTSGFAAKAGFVARWHLVGPFPVNKDNPWDKSWFPEEKIDFADEEKIAGRTLRWKEFTVERPQGMIDLERLFTPHDNVAAYAYAEINAPRAREIHLRIGSDDGVICWLNGERLHANNTSRGWGPDQDTVKARLKQGDNRLLMKIIQGGGPWAFSVRLANTQNRPIDLTRWGERAR